MNKTQNKNKKKTIDSHLLLNEEQREFLNNVINNGKTYVAEWSIKQQEEAKLFMQFYELLPEQLSNDNSKWRKRNSTNRKFEHIDLYQCACGSFYEAHPSTKGIGKSKHQWDFVGCPVYIEIRTEKSNGNYLRAEGVLCHTEFCIQSKPIAPSILNIHPAVKDMALDLLALNVSTSRILIDNQNFIEEKCQGNVILGNHRLLLKPSDISNIMRNFRKSNLNINTRVQVEQSVDNLLSNKSNEQDLSLCKACFHYVSKTEINERLEIGLSTQEQRDLAWKFGHNQLLLLDGTFGVCNRKILLFIFLILDSQKQGIPVAFFLFSPPSNKQASGGYDHKILAKLFEKFVNALGTRDGTIFTPKVFFLD